MCESGKYTLYNNVIFVVQDWANTYHKASIAIQDRELKIEEAAMLIENNLRLLGATAIEDKLQVRHTHHYFTKHKNNIVVGSWK